MVLKVMRQELNIWGTWFRGQVERTDCSEGVPRETVSDWTYVLRVV